MKIDEQEDVLIAAIRSKGPLASADDVFDLVAPFFNDKRGNFSSKLGAMVKRKVIFSGKKGKKTFLSLAMIPGQEERNGGSLSMKEHLPESGCPIADLYTRGLVESLQAAIVPGSTPLRHEPS